MKKYLFLNLLLLIINIQSSTSQTSSTSNEGSVRIFLIPFEMHLGSEANIFTIREMANYCLTFKIVELNYPYRKKGFYNSLIQNSKILLQKTDSIDEFDFEKVYVRMCVELRFSSDESLDLYFTQGGNIILNEILYEIDSNLLNEFLKFFSDDLKPDYLVGKK